MSAESHECGASRLHSSIICSLGTRGCGKHHNRNAADEILPWDKWADLNPMDAETLRRSGCLRIQDVTLVKLTGSGGVGRAKAARIARLFAKHGHGELLMEVNGASEPTAPPLNDSPVSEIGELSARTHHCLSNSGIKTVGDLLSKTSAELLRMGNFGKLSLGELVDALARRGMSLRSERVRAQGFVPVMIGPESAAALARLANGKDRDAVVEQLILAADRRRANRFR